MRFREFNLAVAIVASLGVHALLWPASRRILVPGFGGGGSNPGGKTEISLSFGADVDAPPKKPALAKVPKPSAIDPPDDMGEATGKGTGAQAAKGDTPLQAPEADQDQAFLSRDPVGHGHVGETPTVYTGPRGQDGHGGQRGSPQPTPSENAQPTPSAKPAPESASTAQPPTTPSDSKITSQLKWPKPSPESADPEVKPSRTPPRESVVKAPEPEKPSVTPKDVTPPAAKVASVGASTPDLNKPPADAIKPTAPVTSTTPAKPNANLPAEKDAGPAMAAKPSVGTAPPTTAAPPEHPSVAKAEQYALLPAPVSAPPMPEVKPPKPKPDLPDPTTAHEANPPTPSSPPAARPAPAAQARPATPALVQTGDGLAPGQDRTSADPAQESDSESDAFQKNSVVAVLHDGRLDVRQGRKIKTTRPHFLPGAEVAFFANPDPTIVLKISIDATGNVKDVDIVRSSGSVELDQPTRVAIYDWWFEPTHDKLGRPVADVVLFTIKFR